MPKAVLSCQPSFAKSSTATVVTTTRWSSSKVQNSAHPYNNLNYVNFQKGSSYYSGRNYSTSNFPVDYSSCTINSISISFRGTTVNSSGTGSTTSSNIPTITIRGYNSSGAESGNLIISSNMFNGDNAAATGQKDRKFVFTTNLPANWLNVNNLYTVRFEVNGHFSLRGTYTVNSVEYISNFIITIDYEEPPKPSFTNAPILKVNNTTSSLYHTANLTWTQATLSSGFTSYQSAVTYLILEDGIQIASTNNLSYTYTKQPSSEVILTVQPRLIYSGTTYSGTTSNAVYYSFTPFITETSNLLVNGQTTSRYHQCNLTWTAPQLVSGYSATYQIYKDNVKYATSTVPYYTEIDGSIFSPNSTFYIVTSINNTNFNAISNSVLYVYIPNGLIQATTLDAYYAFSKNWDGTSAPTIVAWSFNKGDTVYVNLNDRKYSDGYYLCYNSQGNAGYIARIYLNIPKNTLHYYSNGKWEYCYAYYYHNNEWKPCIVHYYNNGEWKQCQ